MTGDAPSTAGAGQPRRFEGVDVLVQGEGIRRGVAVEVRDDAIRVDDLGLEGREIWWTSRRAGLLMLFARERTLAVKGRRPVLEELARLVEARRGAAGGRGRLPEALTEEVVVCTAGTAVVGRVGGRKTSGLRVAVFTRRGMHLLTGEDDLCLGWPVEAARVAEGGSGGGRGRALELRKGGDFVRLLYLFPEESEAVLRVAENAPEGEPLRDGVRSVEIPDPPAPPRDGAGAGEGPEEVEVRDGSEDGQELEMFARREVAGPVPPELPEFSLSVDVLREGAEDAAGEISGRRVERAGLAPHFLGTHFLELGETALGPLLLRKSAASTAGTLERSLEAMDAAELEDDTEAAASNAADRLLEVYERELDRLLEEKRAPAEVEEEHELNVEEREDVRLRIHAPFEKLGPLFRDLEESQQELRRRVRALESGPPDADDRRVRESAEAWRRALRRVDRAFVRAWEEVVEEIAGIWDRRLLPSLAEVGAMRRRRMPEWMLLALLAAATLLAAAAVMIFLVR